MFKESFGADEVREVASTRTAAIHALDTYGSGDSAENILRIVGGEDSAELLADSGIRAHAFERAKHLLAWGNAKEALDLANLFDFTQEELRDPDLHLYELGTEYMQRESGHNEVAEALRERFGRTV